MTLATSPQSSTEILRKPLLKKQQTPRTVAGSTVVTAKDFLPVATFYGTMLRRETHNQNPHVQPAAPSSVEQGQEIST
jgi:hypothetical protein